MKHKNQNNSLENFDVAWNESKLFYLFLNELDMDYKEAYYNDDWNQMYKVYKLKKIKVFPYLKLKPEEEADFDDVDDKIRVMLAKLRSGESDAINQFNNTIIQELVSIIEDKIRLLDKKMSEAGLYLLMHEKKEYKPAALAGDDW